MIRLGFAGFWDSFDPRANFLTRLLETRWQIDLVDDPDFLIHSCIGRGRHDHRRFDCVRIFYTGENVPPDWLSTDWAFTFEYLEHPRHFRLPHWPFYVSPPRLVKGPAARSFTLRVRSSRCGPTTVVFITRSRFRDCARATAKSPDTPG